jgi:formylmethanofuran dehydrogenase subunit C
VTLTLTLREPPPAPVDAEALVPARLAGLRRVEIDRFEVGCGNRPMALGELFAISGTPGEDVRIEGDLSRFAGLGAGMTGGRLTLSGAVGPRGGGGGAGRAGGCY